MKNTQSKRKQNQRKRNANQGHVTRNELKQIINELKPKTRKSRNRRRDKGVSLSKVPASMGIDYNVKAPRFKAAKPGSICLSHREMVSVVPGTEDLEMITYQVNPGIPRTFPWLSTLANGFEKFEIRSMQVHYVPICSTAENGTLLMYPEYDVKDPVLDQVSQILNMEGAVSGALWKPHTMTIQPKKFNQVKAYLISSQYEIPEDILLYNPVNINIGVKGAGDSIDVGMLYIDYEIEMLVASTDSGLNLSFGLLQWFGAGFAQINNLWAPTIGNATTAPRCGTFNWNFTDQGTTLQFAKPWVGVCVLYVKVSNGFDENRPVVLSFGGGGQGWYEFESINDTIITGDDTLTFFQILNMPAKSSVTFTGGYTAGNASNDGYLALYPCTPAYWNSVDPNSIAPFNMRRKEEKDLFQVMRPEEHFDIPEFVRNIPKKSLSRPFAPPVRKK